MLRRLERHPAKSKPDRGSWEKNKHPDERDIRQSVVNRLERRSDFGKGPEEKHHCCNPNHLKTNQENSCALNTRERPASLQHSSIKPALVPSRLQRQNIFLLQFPAAFHFKAAALKFLRRNRLIIRRRHYSEYAPLPYIRPLRGRQLAGGHVKSLEKPPAPLFRCS